MTFFWGGYTQDIPLPFIGNSSLRKVLATRSLFNCTDAFLQSVRPDKFSNTTSQGPRTTESACVHTHWRLIVFKVLSSFPCAIIVSSEMHDAIILRKVASWPQATQHPASLSS